MNEGHTNSANPVTDEPVTNPSPASSIPSQVQIPAPSETELKQTKSDSKDALPMEDVTTDQEDEKEGE